MRSLYGAGLLGLLLAQAPAPTGGDACGYRWHTSQSTVTDSAPTYTWVDPATLNGGNPQIVTGLGDDNFVGPIQMPFEFVYYWNRYDRVYVGSNGYVTFGRGYNVSSGPPPYFNRFPSVARPNEWIAVYLSDLTFADGVGAPVPGAKLLYGTDALGRFVITWDSVPYWTDENPQHWRGRNTFQLILDPRDSSITMQYKFIDEGYNSTYQRGNFNVVGMENITGQFGLDIAAAWPVPFRDFAIKIYHPREFSCSVRDIQSDWVFNPKGKAIFVFRGGEGPDLKGGILISGNQPITDSARIRSVLRIYPTGLSRDIYRDTVFFTPDAQELAAGTELTATYRRRLDTTFTDFSANLLSTQIFTATQVVGLMGATDGFSGNNQYVAKLIVSDRIRSGRYQGKYIMRYEDGTWDPQSGKLAGISFANGMTFVAPQDIVVEGISADMFYEVGSADNVPIAFWVYDYDPATDAVGAQRDSVALRVEDFEAGDTLAVFSTLDQSTFFLLRRYVVPLTCPIQLQKGQGIAIGFLSLGSPSSVTNGITSIPGAPASRCALEGIGGIWSPYRDLESEDYAVGLVVQMPVLASLSPVPTPPLWEAELFPNPASAGESPSLRITLPERGEVRIRVLDMQGRTLMDEVRSIPPGGYKFRLPVQLAAGAYIAGVTYQGYTKGFRLVIE